MKILGLTDWSRCKSSHWFSNRVEADFEPKSFMKFINPFSRIAVDMHPIYGHGFRAAKENVFGSMGKGVFVDRDFTRFLHEEHLIKIHRYFSAPIYNFTQPWRKEKLSRLGIKYVIQKERNPEIEADGWIRLAMEDNLVLYENPNSTGVVYLDGEVDLLPLLGDAVTFEGNGLTAALPELHREQELVATFVARPGWQAFVDGREREVYTGKDQLIRVRVKQGDKVVSLRYAPFRWVHFVLCVLTSLALFVGMLFWATFKRGQAFKTKVTS